MKQIDYDDLREMIRELVGKLFIYKNVSINLNDSETICGGYKITLQLQVYDPTPEFAKGSELHD